MTVPLRLKVAAFCIKTGQNYHDCKDILIYILVPKDSNDVIGLNEISRNKSRLCVFSKSIKFSDFLASKFKSGYVPCESEWDNFVQISIENAVFNS